MIKDEGQRSNNSVQSFPSEPDLKLSDTTPKTIQFCGIIFKTLDKPIKLNLNMLD